MKPATAAYAAYALVWIASSAAILGAVYITHSAWCLWAFIIPGSVSLKHRDSKENES